MSDFRVVGGECVAVMREMEMASIDAVVTDPPYDLTAGKRGGSGVASVNLGSPYGRARIGTGNGAGGFMGKAWDATGVAFDPETWEAALAVLKPGGYLLAFGATRTSHRMVCAIEDAGFEIRDAIVWLYGSGFPKSRNLGGGRGTALKPGHEPVCVARKPFRGSAEANVAAHGTAGLNIEACRLPAGDAEYARNCSGDRGHAGTRSIESRGATDLTAGGGSASSAGRWPANVIVDGEAAVLLDAQSGELVSGANPTRRGSDKFRDVYGEFSGQEECEPARGIDRGGASRFYYCAKASRRERDRGLDGENPHPTVKPIDLMRYLVRLVTPAGGVVLDPFAGSGTTGCAARLEGRGFVGIEMEPAYAEVARRRIAAWTPEPSQEALFGL